MRRKHIKNELSVADKLQPIVNIVNEQFLGKDPILDEVINYFTEISYHLPAIYNVQVASNGYWPHITFQSHRTKGFVFRVAGSSNNNNKLECIEFHINHYETYDAWSSGRSYIYIDDIDKSEYIFNKVFKYLNAIMRNPTIATYLNMRYPYNQEYLLQNEFFTEDNNIKKANKFVNEYFTSKRKLQTILNRADADFVKTFYQVSKDFNNQIYKMAYRKNHLINVVAIKSRAKMYYSDNKKWTEYYSKIANIFFDIANKYFKELNNFLDNASNSRYKCLSNYTLLGRLPQTIVVIDGIDSNQDNYNQHYTLYHSLNPFRLKRNGVHIYNDIIYPKRSV